MLAASLSAYADARPLFARALGLAGRAPDDAVAHARRALAVVRFTLVGADA